MEILGLVDVPLWLVLIFMILAILYIHVTWLHSMWSDLGVPAPKPVPFFGNMLMAMNKNTVEAFEDLRRQYGHTYGFYFGRDPLLVTTDKDFIRELTVKQFNDFSNRYSGADSLMQDVTRKMLFFSMDEDWKRYRHLMTPAFTTGKLKALQGYIDKSSKTLVSVFEDMAREKQDVDLKDVYSRFTMDVIAGTAFGLDTNLLKGQEQEQHQMMRAMKGLMDNATGDNPAFIIGMTFPFLGPVLRWLGMTVFPKKHLDVFRGCMQALVADRDKEADAEKRVDFLQQMLALRKEIGASSANGHTDTKQTFNPGDKWLTDEEILAQGIGVFTAGFETTASTLRYLTYSLATNPDVQEKLHEEIIKVVGDGEVTYEKLSEMKYLENIINETLRMYPPLPWISRKAAETVTIKGVTIPKGIGVMLPTFNITHDPDNYPDPWTFRPERFEEEHDNFVSVLPFGFGPRHCIGMRLALLEIKVAAVHVFRKIRFTACDATVKTFKFTNQSVLTPKVPLIARAELRE